MLVRLLHRWPELPEADAIHAWFDATWTAANIEVEVAYLADPVPTHVRASLRLGLAGAAPRGAARPGDEPGRRPGTARRGPVAGDARTAPAAARRSPRLVADDDPAAEPCGHPRQQRLRLHPAPRRGGGRPDAADLVPAVHDAARRWYLDDRDAAVAFEPSGADFLSPALTEAGLLARVLQPDDYRTWLDRFLPDPTPLTVPVVVDDRTDPQTVHLDGCNLSRAWCWRRLAAPLPETDPRRHLAVDAARAHRDASLAHVLDDYVGAHWLPSFVVYLADVEVETAALER
jgi:hypothetical protein